MEVVAKHYGLKRSDSTLKVTYRLLQAMCVKAAEAGHVVGPGYNDTCQNAQQFIGWQRKQERFGEKTLKSEV